MNPLASRKKLLIAESELNRAQLIGEWRTLVDGAHSLAKQARTISWFASAAAALLAVLTSLRHKNSAPAAEKTSWWKALLKGAGQLSAFWLAFRPPGREREESKS